jgi:hypothetical protein
MKTGKLDPKHHPKTLMFSKYAAGVLPIPAAKVFREYKVPDAAKQMFGNDSIGDCTCAGAANLLILMTCHTGEVVIPSLDEVIGLYSAVTGYVPGDDSTDNGAAMTDVLAYLQSTGLAGHKILAWAQIDHTNLAHRQLGVDLFGATYVGVQLPASAQKQFSKGQSWEVVKHDSIEGGHAIIHPGYGLEGGDYVTWAKWDQKASSAWESAYIDEEYVLITEDWLNQATKQTPGGIDLPTLQADIALLRQ